MKQMWTENWKSLGRYSNSSPFKGKNVRSRPHSYATPTVFSTPPGMPTTLLIHPQIDVT
jgi:hypothetical protein